MHDDGVCGLILVNVCGFVVMGGWKRGCGININGSGGEELRIERVIN